MPSQTAPPEIPEGEATGTLAALYADIREVTGRPAINLLFRTLAAAPGALAWSWQVLKPAYRTGVFDVAGDGLIIDVPPVRPFNRPALDDAGVTEDSLPTVQTILAHYNGGNRSTIIALSVLREALDRPCRVAVAADDRARHRPAYELPPLLALDQMDRELRDRVVALSGRLGGDRAVVVPGIYRHLAHWPRFLALIASELAPLFEDGSITARMTAVQQQADERAIALISSPAGALPPPHIVEVVSTITDEFRHKVAEMLVIGLLLEAMLPRGTP